MKLSDLAEIKTNYPEADFWLIRRGSVKQCGKPVRTFNREHFGVKVRRTDILLPDYLYYVFLHFHSSKMWEPLTHGTLNLVNIQLQDVKNIKLELT